MRYTNETHELIKEAAYDLKIGLAEIQPMIKSDCYLVKFENDRGGPVEIIVPMAATYGEIRAALQKASAGD